jgi:hypothetical protein
VSRHPGSFFFSLTPFTHLHIIRANDFRVADLMTSSKIVINWRLTRRVREAVLDDRVIVSEHFLSKAARVALQDDELKAAVDGYKHFLEAMSRDGRIFEIVFKFVFSHACQAEELLILITAYRGRT